MKDLVKLKNYSSRIDAEVDKALLGANDILSFVSADDVGGFYPSIAMATGGVWLLVDKKDHEKALGLLM